jgi:hypothetical protein
MAESSVFCEKPKVVALLGLPSMTGVCGSGERAGDGDDSGQAGRRGRHERVSRDGNDDERHDEVRITARDGSWNSTTTEWDLDVAGTGNTSTYDANGNLTSDGTRSFEWDARNQLMAVNVGAQRSEFVWMAINGG